MTKGGRGRGRARAPRQRRDTREEEGGREQHARQTEMATAAREDRDANLRDDPRVGVVNSVVGNSNGRDGVGSGDRDTRGEGQEERELAKKEYQNSVELWIRPETQMTFLGKASIERMRQMDDKDLEALFADGLISADAARAPLRLVVHQFRLAYPQAAPVPPPTLKETSITFSRALEPRTLNFLGEDPHDFNCHKRWNFGNRHLESLMLHLDLQKEDKPVVYVIGQVPGCGKTSLCLFAASQFDRIQKGVEGTEKFKETLKSSKLSKGAQKEKTSIFYVGLEEADQTATDVRVRMIAAAYGANRGTWRQLSSELSERGKVERLIVVIDEFQSVTSDEELRDFFNKIAPIANHCIFIVAGASVQMVTAIQHRRVSRGSRVGVVIPLVLPPIKVSDWMEILKTTKTTVLDDVRPGISQAPQPETLAEALLRADLKLQLGDDIEKKISETLEFTEDEYLESLVYRIVGDTGGLPRNFVNRFEATLAKEIYQPQAKYPGFPKEDNVEQLADDVVSLVMTTALGPDLSAHKVVARVFGESVFSSADRTDSTRSMRQRAANAILLSGIEIKCPSRPDLEYRFCAEAPEFDATKSGVLFISFGYLKELEFEFFLTPYCFYRAATATDLGEKLGVVCDSNLTKSEDEMRFLVLLKRGLDLANGMTLRQLFPMFKGHPLAASQIVSTGVDPFAGAKVVTGRKGQLTVDEMLKRSHHRTEATMTDSFSPSGKEVRPQECRGFLKEKSQILGDHILLYVPGRMSHSADFIVLAPLPSGKVAEIHFQHKAPHEYNDLTPGQIKDEHEKSERSSNDGSISVIVIFNHIRPSGDNVRTTGDADEDKLQPVNHKDGRKTYRAVVRGLNHTEILEQFIKINDFDSLIKRGLETAEHQTPTRLKKPRHL